MKRLSYILPILTGPIIFKVSTASAQNANILEGIYKGCKNIQDPDKGTLTCAITNTINMLGTFVGAILVVMIIISGIIYMTSMGNPDKVGLAKKTLVGAIIGLIIVVLSSFTVNLIYTLFQ